MCIISKERVEIQRKRKGSLYSVRVNDGQREDKAGSTFDEKQEIVVKEKH